MGTASLYVVGDHELGRNGGQLAATGPA
jgi:hypothetical protein